MSIITEMSEASRLEMLAEECAELGHAALKLARILRRENPTPIPEDKARKNLTSEIADVLVAMNAVTTSRDIKDIDSACTEKLDRWTERLQAAQAMTINGKRVLPG